MKFAVIANPSKYEVKEVMLSTIEWAQKNEVELFLYSSVAKQLHLEPSDTLTLTESDGDSIEAGEIILVMGGDGTILYTARIGKRTEKPVLGINSGRLGFMTNIQQEDLNNALDNVLAGDYTLDKRHFLRAMDKDGEKYHALNEFLFTRKDTTSMINISADYDGNYIDHIDIYSLGNSEKNQIRSILEQYYVQSILGDVNGDLVINVQDIVLAVNLVLGGEYSSAADLNSDNLTNILDVVQIINIILS